LIGKIFNIHGITLSLETTQEELFGETFAKLNDFYSYFCANTNPRTTADIRIVLTKKIPRPQSRIEKLWTCTPGFFFHKGTISYNDYCIFFKKGGSSFSIVGLSSKKTSLEANITRLKPLKQLSLFLLAEKMLERGCLFVHAGGVSTGNSGIIMPAWGHAGKTALSLHLVNRGYKYFGDDKIIVSKDAKMLSFPTSLQVFGYDFAACGFLGQSSSSGQPSYGRFVELPISSVLTDSQIGRIAHISQAFLIRRSPNGYSRVIEEKNREIMVRKIVSITLNEFSYICLLHNVLVVYCSNRSELMQHIYSKIMSKACHDMENHVFLVPDRKIPPAAKISEVMDRFIRDYGILTDTLRVPPKRCEL